MKKKPRKHRYGPAPIASNSQDRAVEAQKRSLEFALREAENGLMRMGWKHRDAMPVIASIAEDPFVLRHRAFPKKKTQTGNWVRDQWLAHVERRRDLDERIYSEAGDELEA